MLKGISPLLNADVLYALSAMGHGDHLIIADAHFPADAIARQSRLGRLLRIDNVTAEEAVTAILAVMPLDETGRRMEIVDEPATIPPVQEEVQKAIDTSQGESLPMTSLDRFAFYDHAKNAYCVIQTGDTRFYGCFSFTKGVVQPDVP